jgi:hypothetical protein
MTDQTDNWLDEDGYPTDAALKRITEWPHTDFPALLEFLKSIWWCPDFGWTLDGTTLYLSTGGWSGNEDLIRALQQNKIFWVMCWEMSRVGGHYEFDLSRVKGA